MKKVFLTESIKLPLAFYNLYFFPRVVKIFRFAQFDSVLYRICVFFTIHLEYNCSYEKN